METYFGAMAQARRRVARERVWADLQRLARHAEDLLQATADDTSDETRNVRSRLIAALERAKAAGREWPGQALAAAQAAARATDAVLRRHPFASIGVAFGAGFALGVLVAPGGGRPGQDSRRAEESL